MKKSKILFFLLLIVFVFLKLNSTAQEKLANSDRISPEDTKAIIDWLSENAIPLENVEAGHGFADLQPLKGVLKDVRIVGLGEATHGTREFFQFKHRMLEFLVEEMDYSIFAIEASYPACFNINDYVLYGKGDREEALASQKFWTWDTNEVTDLIEWMRQYNKASPESKKVKFLGIDLQHVEQAVDVVKSYLKKVSPEFLETADKTLKIIDIERQKYAKFSPEEKRENKKSLFELMGYLAFNKMRFIRASSREEYEKVMQHARVFFQYFDMLGSPGFNPYESSPIEISIEDAIHSSIGKRDYYMAENIESMIHSEKPGTRIVLWAHNTHIAIQKHTYTGWKNFPPMGYYLRKVFGDGYYSLGFVFNHGSFQAKIVDEEDDRYRDIEECTLKKAPKGSIEWYLSQVGIPNFIIDLRSAPKKGKVAKWLNSEHLMCNIGGGFSYKWTYQYLVPTVLTEHFDGILYIDKTTRARPNH